jgi:hypothetical protein
LPIILAIDDYGNQPCQRLIVLSCLSLEVDASAEISCFFSVVKITSVVQSALGDWHDHYQWCQKAQVEKDLLPLQSVWLDCAASALQKAEVQSVEMAKLLSKSSGKKTA